MNTPRFPLATLLLALGLSLVGCSDTSAPDARYTAVSAAPLHNVWVGGPQDIPFEDNDSLPPQFNAAPLIHWSALDSDFTSNYAFATASMRYFASHAKIDVTLKVKRGTEVVDSGSSVAVDENLLPFFNTIVAPLTISNPGPCGHRLDAKALYSAWMAFPIPKTGTLFSWGLTTSSLSKPSAQPDCPPPPPPPPPVGGGGNDWDYLWDSSSDDSENQYDGSCGLYQLWIATIDGVVVDWWWERTDVDDEYCNSF